MCSVILNFEIFINLTRARTGHGKPGNSWNLRISFSRPGKSWNLIVSPWKLWKIKVLFSRSVTADDKECKIKRSNNIKQHERQAFWWIAEFVSVELSKVLKKYAKTIKVLKIFENDS